MKEKDPKPKRGRGPPAHLRHAGADPPIRKRAGSGFLAQSMGCINMVPGFICHEHTIIDQFKR